MKAVQTDSQGRGQDATPVNHVHLENQARTDLTHSGCMEMSPFREIQLFAGATLGVLSNWSFGC